MHQLHTWKNAFHVLSALTISYKVQQLASLVQQGIIKMLLDKKIAGHVQQDSFLTLANQNVTSVHQESILTKVMQHAMHVLQALMLH